VKGFAWGINKMGLIFGAKFALLGPYSGKMINRYRKIIKLNYKSTFINVLERYYAKKNISILLNVLLIFFSEFVL
jgi:hypothetical protein